MKSLGVPYLTDQLIPYIGNKRKLLPLIRSAIAKTELKSGTFFDVFAGSGVVSRLAKMAGFCVAANDWEPYSQYINNAYIAANEPPEFCRLGGLDSAISQLNSLEGIDGYITEHYCPADDENYDVSRERMFYTHENGRRIDAMREQIAQWKNEGNISDIEECVLLASLIYQASYCSNTSGVFKGFHRGWGGATGTALYRIKSTLTLKSPVFYDNHRQNHVYRADSNAIARNIKCDIAYLDPPYNQHQYGSNYHMLNTVALWDKPPINKYISNDGIHDKAAIRKDWRTQRRSPYCYKSTALKTFTNLVNNIDSGASYILMSYSTDGLIPVEDALSCLSERGDLSVVVQKYKRYRVSSQRPSPRAHTTEFVAIVNTKKKIQDGCVEKAVQEIMSEKDELCSAENMR